MANKEHLKILRQGVEAWNRWREKNPDVRPNLFRADLSDVDLREADLIEVNLIEADLSGANLSGANLRGVNLIEANLIKAYLIKADLSGANLSHADFTGTDLTGTNLTGADLREANLSETLMVSTTFADVDLKDVKGLDTVTHFGPSYIDTHTLTQSKGQIPEVFLRGCGLSDTQIEMAKLHNPHLTDYQITDITYKIHNLLTGPAIKYNSCFISYSHKDDAFARQLHTDLQETGVRCWFAPEDMKIGDKIRHTIDQSIRIHDKLLLVLSKCSVASRWVEHEVEHALELEAERGEPVLFPVRLDEAIMESKVGWAGNIKRGRHIGDFSKWQDYDAYQGGFERLLRDLRAGA